MDELVWGILTLGQGIQKHGHSIDAQINPYDTLDPIIIRVYTILSVSKTLPQALPLTVFFFLMGGFKYNIVLSKYHVQHVQIPSIQS